jgi:HEAT repeat protein
VIDRIEETLRAMLSDTSPAVREAASASLDRIRARRSLPSYLEKLRSGTVEERLRVVYVAEDIGGSEGTAILLAALGDAEAEVRGAAARVLSGFPTPAVLKAMVGRLPRETGPVLGNLIESLGNSRRKELCPIIERYLEHPDPFVRGKAVAAYARVAEGAGWERILSQAGAGSDTVRAAVARILGEWTAP